MLQGYKIRPSQRRNRITLRFNRVETINRDIIKGLLKREREREDNNKKDGWNARTEPASVKGREDGRLREFRGNRRRKI